MNIEGENIILKAIEKEDLPILNQWANAPQIQYMLGGWHFPTNMNDQQQWFASLNVGSTHQRFAIHIANIGIIGTANLVDIDWKNGTAFHGILIGNPEVQGKGYAKDTIKTIMKYAFEELRLYRLETTIIEYNETSLNLYKKCGWKQEGVQKEWYYRKNKRWDRFLMGITASEYDSFHNKNITN